MEPLITLGFDSLMAVNLKRLIENDFAAVVPVGELLKGASTVEVATLILNQLSVAASNDLSDDRAEVEL